MKKTISAILILACGILPKAQIENPGFETTEADFPSSWNAKTSKIYTVKADPNVKHSGANSLSVSGEPGQGMQPFSQMVPIPGSGLRKLEISAYVKSENVTGNIGLWSQVKDKNKKSIDFGNSDSQNNKIIPNTGWKRYSLEFVVDDEAKSFLLGGFLAGNGRVWFDDFSIREIAFSQDPTSEAAMKYIDDFKNIIRKNSAFKGKIDWNKVDADLEKVSKGMSTVKDTSPALSYIMKALKAAGDNHSFIESRETAEKKSTGNPIGIEPEYKMLDQQIGYIMVPAFSSVNKEVGNAFAEKIQNMIRQLDMSKDIKGWVVDLRQNTGGNMYPMIVGLGPLTGEGILGYFTKDGKSKSSWTYQKGKSYNVKVARPYVLKNQNQKIAILIGPRTASSGEATAISFLGKTNTKTFGQPSAGYTTANQSYQLSDGKNLLLAVSYEMDRTGKEYMERIQPDELVEPSKEHSNKDAELQAATQWIIQ